MLNNDRLLINFIEERTKDIAGKLKLKLPKIEIDKCYNNCSCFEEESKILFGLIFIKELKFENLHIESVPPDIFLNRVYFVIAHEVGHILQFTKHRKWFDKYKESYKLGIGIEDYVEQKIEKNASKIANILLKEYKKDIQLC